VLQDSIPFGACWVNDSRNKEFELLNAGTAPLLVNVVSPCSQFEVVSGGGTYQIAAGTSVNVVVAFKPTGGGPASCQIALGPACPDVGVSGMGISISFANDVQPILTNRCTGACHEHPYFTDPQSYDTYDYLVAQGQYYQDWRIKPFSLDHSWLYQYVLSGYMPADGTQVPDIEVDTIRQWIIQGALNN
jgi:hypothetical protein